MSVRRGNDAPEPVLPAGLTTAVGGPAGRRLRRPDAGPLAPLAPVVLLLAVPLSLAALRQAGCLADGWRGGTPLWRQCGSPLVESLPAADLGRGLTAYLSGDVRLDEPVLTGAVTAALAGFSPGAGTGEQRWFLVLWMLLASVLLVALVVVVGTVRRHPAANPVVVALSPVVALTVLLSADLVPIVLAATGVWAWTRDRARLAGALIGVAVLGGALAAVVLPVLALLPGPGGVPAVRRLLVAAGVTVAALAASVSFFDVDTLIRPYAAWLTDGAGPGSPWYLATLAGHPPDARLVVAGAALGWVAAAVLVVVHVRRRPRPVIGAVVVVGLAVVLVTGPSLPPQSALWLLPFLALVGLGWRDHLVWAGAEAVHAVALSAYLAAAADPQHGLPAGWYALALSLRLLAVGWVASRAWVAAGERGPAPSGGTPGAEVRGTADGASWVDAEAAGTLAWLPSRRPVEKSTGRVGGNAYPPVTEGP